MRNVLLLAALAACHDRTISEVNPEQGRVEVTNYPVNPRRDIDILFVIDDSKSMADKQANLKANFPAFIEVLEGIEGGLPNIHLGVVSTDLGTKGALDATAGPAIGGCSGSGKSGNLQLGTATSELVQGNFISDTKNADGSRNTNYSGTLSAAFSAIATIGDGGCGFEQHLEAAKRALDNNPANQGFMRQDAFLALVFIQDEDDCSMAHSTLLSSDTSALGPLQSFRCNRFGHVCAQGGQNSDQMNQTGPKGDCTSNESSQYLTKVDDYIRYFKGLKADPKDVIVAGISGPTTPYEVELRAPPGGTTAIPAVAHSCSYEGAMGPEVADPSTRLEQFLRAFDADRTTFSTICQRDLSGALRQIAESVELALGSSCIQGKLVDGDEAPGLQPDCQVSDMLHYGKANQTEVVLPACNNTNDPATSTNKPCWSIQSDPTNCKQGAQLALKVERDEAAAPDTHVVGYCVTESGMLQ